VVAGAVACAKPSAGLPVRFAAKTIPAKAPPRTYRGQHSEAEFGGPAVLQAAHRVFQAAPQGNLLGALGGDISSILLYIESVAFLFCEKMQISSKPFMTGFVVILFLAACEEQSAKDFVENLPPLPPEIVSTLDPATMATKTAHSFSPPETAAGAAQASCCSITDQRSLKVNFPHTKCTLIGIIGVTDLALFRSNQQTDNPDKLYRLEQLAGARLRGPYLCVTSQGPWNASLAEIRACQNYAPRQELTISAHDELIQFVWNGGVENHPPEVKLVSCRHDATVRFACNPLSNCGCSSTACPASDPCECNLPW
jgi:hypothetical protein